MWAIVLVSTLLVFVPSTVKCQSACPSGWNQYESTCVQVTQTAFNWGTGLNECFGKGAMMASIKDSSYNSFIKNLLTPGERYWLGKTIDFNSKTFYDYAGLVDDEPLGFPWSMYEPRKNPQSRCWAIIVGGGLGKWVAKPCDWEYKVVCEMSIDT